LVVVAHLRWAVEKLAKRLSTTHRCPTNPDLQDLTRETLIIEQAFFEYVDARESGTSGRLKQMARSPNLREFRAPGQIDLFKTRASTEGIFSNAREVCAPGQIDLRKTLASFEGTEKNLL